MNTHALSVLAFSVMSFLLLYGIARFQGVLPFNPTDKPAVTDHVAFNAAVSFMTNTNWQSYSGEATMSHYPDDRAGAELRLRVRRHARAGNSDQRSGLQTGEHARLGRPRPHRVAHHVSAVVRGDPVISRA